MMPPAKKQFSRNELANKKSSPGKSNAGKMRTPLVSIIIPCWNAESYIGEAIESALAQIYKRVEVIVIDDGSTDSSLDVIKSFGSHIRWRTGPNKGASAARNKGIALAKGELTQLLDADDLLHPEKLERQTAECLKYPGEIVYCDWTMVDVASGKRRIFSHECDGIDAVAYALQYQIPITTPLHWRSLLKALGGFRERLPCGQDRDLNIRIACSGVNFHHLPSVLCTIRRRPGSVSADMMKVLDQHPGIALEAEALLRERGELTEPRARALAGFLARDARIYLRHGQFNKARLNFSEARRMHASGGLPEAYGNSTIRLRRCCGALVTELLVGLKRRLWPARKPGPSVLSARAPQVRQVRGGGSDLLDQRNT